MALLDWQENAELSPPALFRLRRVAFQRAALGHGTKRQRQLEIERSKSKPLFSKASDGLFRWLSHSASPNTQY